MCTLECQINLFYYLLPEANIYTIHPIFYMSQNKMKIDLIDFYIIYECLF